MANRRIAVYPGTFDPITNGHIDLVNRAAPLFEKVIVGIAQSTAKGPSLSLEQRVELARDALARHGNVEVRGFDTLLAQLQLKSATGTLGETDIQAINGLLDPEAAGRPITLPDTTPKTEPGNKKSAADALTGRKKK